jgi:hypothetical protein
MAIKIKIPTGRQFERGYTQKREWDRNKRSCGMTQKNII